MFCSTYGLDSWRGCYLHDSRLHRLNFTLKACNIATESIIFKWKRPVKNKIQARQVYTDFLPRLIWKQRGSRSCVCALHYNCKRRTLRRAAFHAELPKNEVKATTLSGSCVTTVNFPSRFLLLLCHTVTPCDWRHNTTLFATLPLCSSFLTVTHDHLHKYAINYQTSAARKCAVCYSCKYTQDREGFGDVLAWILVK
jgi:hypothetical protein